MTAPSDNGLGVALAYGSLLATVRSRRTGQHIVVRLSAKRPPDGAGRWQHCRFDEARYVFADVPAAGARLYPDPIGRFDVAAGRFYPDRRADPARVWCAEYLLRLASGGEPHPQAEVLPATHCRICGRELTDPESIERGIGPTCYEAATSSVPQTKRPPAIEDDLGVTAATDEAGAEREVEEVAAEEGPSFENLTTMKERQA